MSQRPWQELLLTGRFGAESVRAFPGAYMTAAPWRRLLEKAPESPAGLYHLGVMAHGAGEPDTARACLERSAASEPSAAAYRALARLDMLDGRKKDCLMRYEQALRLDGAHPDLRLEYAQTLLALGEPERLAAFLASLDGESRRKPRFQYLLASALTELGRYDEAEEILLRPLVIPDMREGELSLYELWLRIHMGREGLSREEAGRLHPLPEALDFRMH